MFLIHFIKSLLTGRISIPTIPLKEEGLPVTRLGFYRIPFLSDRIALSRIKKALTQQFFHGHLLKISRTGSGKSYLLLIFLLTLKLENLLLRTKINTSRSAMVIDPHGDTAQKMAQLFIFWGDFQKANRKKKIPNLVYISPEGSAFPCLNPFDSFGEPFEWHRIERKAQFLNDALLVMLSRGEVGLTLQMRTIVDHALKVLLTLSHLIPSRTVSFDDLLKFMDHRRNHFYIKFGITHVPNQHIRDFLLYDFKDSRYSNTRFSLRVKLSHLLSSSYFVDLLCRKSTWNLHHEVKRGATILINASKSILGSHVSEIYGRLLIAMLKSVMMGQGHIEREKRKKVFLILDEAPTFYNPSFSSLWAEFLKFGLRVISVQQNLNMGGASKEFTETMLGNTSVKCVGETGYTSKSHLAKECHTDMENMQDLPIGTFLIKSWGRKVRKVHIPPNWLHKRHYMKERQWKEVSKYMKRHYHRATRSLPISQANTKNASSKAIRIQSPRP